MLRITRSLVSLNAVELTAILTMPGHDSAVSGVLQIPLFGGNEACGLAQRRAPAYLAGPVFCHCTTVCRVGHERSVKYLGESCVYDSVAFEVTRTPIRFKD